MAEVRGIGDRWLAGEAIEGVRFAHGDVVQVAAGTHAGTIGTILLLLRAHPEPRYLVRIAGEGTGVDLRLAQSSLAPAS